MVPHSILVPTHADDEAVVMNGPPDFVVLRGALSRRDTWAMLTAVRRLLILSLACAPWVAGAQQQSEAPPQGVTLNMNTPLQEREPPAGPTGSVTGTVIGQDTSQPARFAEVMLQRVTPTSTDASGRTGGVFAGFGGGSQARTEVDGTFEITGVAPGDYYVTASAPGYIPEREILQTAVAAGADPADLLARIPVVHVTADSVSSINVTLQRGGVLSGRVNWEDGSPATGVTVMATLTPQPPALPNSLQVIRSPGPGATTAITDDRGNFRIAGMAAGDYLLEAVLQSRGGFGGFGRGQVVSTIRVYAPGTFHKASAKPITLHNGEERDDVRLVIDLRGLHTVSGHATSASSTQTVASGRVVLSDPTDTSLQLMGSIQPDGSFSVRYVPPGSYTLQIGGASTQANGGFGGRGRGGGSSSGGTSFQSFTMPVTVSDSDLTGVAAPLTPAQ